MLPSVMAGQNTGMLFFQAQKYTLSGWLMAWPSRAIIWALWPCGRQHAGHARASAGHALHSSTRRACLARARGSWAEAPPRTFEGVHTVPCCRCSASMASSSGMIQSSNRQ
jgi:hypothetical protein